MQQESAMRPSDEAPQRASALDAGAARSGSSMGSSSSSSPASSSSSSTSGTAAKLILRRPAPAPAAPRPPFRSALRGVLRCEASARPLTDTAAMQS